MISLSISAATPPPRSCSHLEQTRHRSRSPRSRAAISLLCCRRTSVVPSSPAVAISLLYLLLYAISLTCRLQPTRLLAASRKPLPHLLPTTHAPPHCFLQLPMPPPLQPTDALNSAFVGGDACQLLLSHPQPLLPNRVAAAAFHSNCAFFLLCSQSQLFIINSSRRNLVPWPLAIPRRSFLAERSPIFSATTIALSSATVAASLCNSPPLPAFDRHHRCFLPCNRLLAAPTISVLPLCYRFPAAPPATPTIKHCCQPRRQRSPSSVSSGASSPFVLCSSVLLLPCRHLPAMQSSPLLVV
ncbi:hypothetical protein B296_00056062 [Ensete ventricosum]|uniref:Uncharacterized protein n=1 Tax=Ensete ventricosum TaxID=4639 RepID=A0A426XWY5_ENSVE|nr:hypothetical protein B296_00056062 [Ensete ventricosum]